jgi:hypothetical protein
MNVLIWIGCFLLCIVMVAAGMLFCAMAILLLEVAEDFGYAAKRTEAVISLQRSRSDDTLPVLRRR